MSADWPFNRLYALISDDMELADQELADERSRPYWRTAAGEEIPIDEMPDNHLLASILYVERRGGDHEAIYKLLVDEAKQRGLMLTVKAARSTYAAADAIQRTMPAGNYLGGCGKRVSTIGDAKCALDADHKGLCSAVAPKQATTTDDAKTSRWLLLEID